MGFWHWGISKPGHNEEGTHQFPRSPHSCQGPNHYQRREENHRHEYLYTAGTACHLDTKNHDLKLWQ